MNSIIPTIHAPLSPLSPFAAQQPPQPPHLRHKTHKPHQSNSSPEGPSPAVDAPPPPPTSADVGRAVGGRGRRGSGRGGGLGGRGGRGRARGASLAASSGARAGPAAGRHAGSGAFETVILSSDDEMVDHAPSEQGKATAVQGKRLRLEKKLEQVLNENDAYPFGYAAQIPHEITTTGFCGVAAKGCLHGRRCARETRASVFPPPRRPSRVHVRALPADNSGFGRGWRSASGCAHAALLASQCLYPNKTEMLIDTFFALFV
jgi:hypothetical protein